MAFPVPIDPLAPESLDPFSDIFCNASLFPSGDLTDTAQDLDVNFSIEPFPIHDLGRVDNTSIGQEEALLSNPLHSMGKPFACNSSGCSYRATSRRDIDRHNTARHLRGPKDKFFCLEPGCARARKGWSRKDLRDRHVRTVHGINGDQATSVSPVAIPNDDDDAQDCTVDDAGIEDQMLKNTGKDVIVGLKKEIAELKAERIELKAGLADMQRKFEKMRCGVMIAVAAAN